MIIKRILLVIAVLVLSAVLGSIIMGVIGGARNLVVIDTPELSRPVSQDIALLTTNPFGAHDPIYDQLGYPGHPGIDYEAPLGTPINSCDDGTVTFAGAAGTAGNMVIVTHSYGKTRYLHLSEIQVATGTEVTKGEQIGLSGNTGLSTGPHLHLDLYLNSAPVDNGYDGRVDPLPYIGG